MQSKPNLLIFWAWVFVLGALCFRLLSAGYISAETIQDISKLKTAVMGFEALPGLAPQYPQFSFFASLFALLIPGITAVTAPFAMSCLCGGVLVAYAFRRFRANHRSVGRAMILVTLLGLHPIFLWTVTDSSRLAFTAIAYSLTFSGLTRLRGADEMRGYFLAASGMALGFLSSPGFAFFCISIFLLLPIFLSLPILRTSTSAGYYTLLFPLVASVLSILYLGWVLLGSAPTIISLLNLGLHLLPEGPLSSPWLLKFGDSLLPLGLRATLCLFGWILIGFPAVFLCRRSGYKSAAAVLLAGGLATAQFGVNSPGAALSAMIPLLMVALPRAVSASKDKFLIPLLLVGLIGGWAVFPWYASSAQIQWKNAFTGNLVALTYSDDISLSDWLSRYPAQTMIDPTAGFAVMATAKNSALFLGAARFQYDIQRGVLSAEQVAVSDPESPRGALDLINRRYPSVYLHGIEGFTLAYEGAHWRVYRQLNKADLWSFGRETRDPRTSWLNLLGGRAAWVRLALLGVVLVFLQQWWLRQSSRRHGF